MSYDGWWCRSSPVAILVHILEARAVATHDPSAEATPIPSRSFGTLEEVNHYLEVFLD
jgi:hypothetical protein